MWLSVNDLPVPAPPVRKSDSLRNARSSARDCSESARLPAAPLPPPPPPAAAAAASAAAEPPPGRGASSTHLRSRRYLRTLSAPMPGRRGRPSPAAPSRSPSASCCRRCTRACRRPAARAPPRCTAGRLPRRPRAAPRPSARLADEADASPPPLPADHAALGAPPPARARAAAHGSVFGSCRVFPLCPRHLPPAAATAAATRGARARASASEPFAPRRRRRSRAQRARREGGGSHASSASMSLRGGARGGRRPSPPSARAHTAGRRSADARAAATTRLFELVFQHARPPGCRRRRAGGELDAVGEVWAMEQSGFPRACGFARRAARECLRGGAALRSTARRRESLAPPTAHPIPLPRPSRPSPSRRHVRGCWK